MTYDLIFEYIDNLAKYRNQNNFYIEVDNFNHKIKEQFMYFLASIFLDYANFIKYDFEVVDNFLLNPEYDFNIEKLYDIEGFINSHKVDEAFYRKFFHTKIFKNFI